MLGRFASGIAKCQLGLAVVAFVSSGGCCMINVQVEFVCRSWACMRMKGMG